MPSKKKEAITPEVSSTEVVTATVKVPVEGVKVAYVVNGNVHHNKAYYEKGQVVTHSDEYFDVLQSLGLLTQKEND